MADVKDYKIFKNSNFEILTEDGFKNFEGIIMGKNDNKIKLSANNKSLICTPKHKIMISISKWKYAKDLKVGDVLYNNIIVEGVDHFKNDKLVYEFLEVEGNHTYIVNGILSHQCLMLDEFAIIRDEIADEFYEAVVPTISSSAKAKLILSSTPKGTSGRYYKIYSEAEIGQGNKEWNGWKAEKIMWDEVPRYNKKGELDFTGFKNDQLALFGGDENMWLQEFCCMFLEDGAAALNASVLEKLKTKIKMPKFQFDDGDYLVWEEPVPGHIYSIGVDTSEGVGLDSSVAQIIDITDLTDIRQVGQYHSKSIQPYVFAEKLNQIAKSWGNPYMCIERNGPGGQVIDALYEVHNYDNIVHYSMKNDARSAYQKLGIFCHTNSKYTGIMNAKYWLEHIQSVTIYDVNTLKEYETFRRKVNGTWSAQDGFYDDRVMSMVWALIILETEICQKHFNILAYDAIGKPKIIKDVSAEFSEYLGIFDTKDNISLSDPSPSFLGINTFNINEVNYLDNSDKELLEAGNFTII